MRGDEGIELVGALDNGNPASVGEAAKVAAKLKQTIFHLVRKYQATKRLLKIHLLDPKDLILCLPNKLCFSGFGPLPADQAVPSSVAVGTLLFQEVVDPGGVAKA